MDLNEWRERQRGEEFELPSGLVIRLKRVGLLDLASQGQIPAPLLDEIHGLLDLGKTGELTTAHLAERIRVLRAVARAAIVEPPVGDAPAEGVLGIEELGVPDLLAVFSWTNGAGVALRPFRRESG